MGYDLYGVNPVGYDKGEYPLLTMWEGKSWKERKDEMPEKDEDEYWSQMGRRDSESGGYFRANVWWWRRIWIFTCNICKDVMTQNDIDAGDSNSGIEISEETCLKMLPLMKEAIKDGSAMDYQKTVTEYCASVEKEDNGFIKSDDDFMANYPFSVEYFKEFTTFVERCGGFTIS